MPKFTGRLVRFLTAEKTTENFLQGTKSLNVIDESRFVPLKENQRHFSYQVPCQSNFEKTISVERSQFLFFFLAFERFFLPKAIKKLGPHPNVFCVVKVRRTAQLKIGQLKKVSTSKNIFQLYFTKYFDTRVPKTTQELFRLPSLPRDEKN